MSKHDIEDVLSSIRRLVSGELRPPTLRTGASADGKLILTPALRVVADESDRDLAVMAPDDTGFGDAPVLLRPTDLGQGGATPSRAEDALRVAAPIGAPSVDVAPEIAPEDAPLAFRRSATAGLVLQDLAPQGLVLQDLAPQDLAPQDRPAAPRAAAPAALLLSDAPAPSTARSAVADGVFYRSASVRDAGLAPGAASDEVSADVIGGAPAPDAVHWGAGVWDDRPVPVPASEDLQEDAPELSGDAFLHALKPDAAAPDPVPAAPMWSDVDVAAPVWAEADPLEWLDDDPIPFVPHARRPALTADPLALAWAESAEAAVRADLQQAEVDPALLPRRASDPVLPVAEPPEAADADSVTAGAETGLFDPDGPAPAALPEMTPAELGVLEDAGPVDEEMLREIVRDIIREELAGTLGERITRNVRKLVRVEINRALTNREFG